ncbi:hypothetical protein AB0J52_31725 [Spirillospora sp. NPDC049652]
MAAATGRSYGFIHRTRPGVRTSCRGSPLRDRAG